MGTNWQWFEKNHFYGCKMHKTVSIIARLKHFVLISWIQSSDYFSTRSVLCFSPNLSVTNTWLSSGLLWLLHGLFSALRILILLNILLLTWFQISCYSNICMMSKEFSTIKYLKQYYTEYSCYGIKHWRVYYCIFTRDDSELKYSPDWTKEINLFQESGQKTAYTLKHSKTSIK